MQWHDKIDEVYLINLSERIDRYCDFVKQADEYNIPFTRFEAIDNKQYPAHGLRDSMVTIFKDALGKGHERIMVFEDDALIIEPLFNDILTSALEQLPDNFHILYGGCQPTCGYKDGFYSHNLLRVRKGYATHHCIYSRAAMEILTTSYWEPPIDNWIVEHMQGLGNCYAIHPFLTTQSAGFSNIGKSEIDWNPFLSVRHNQKVLELLQSGIHRPSK
jgi:hypothetical protein